MLTFSRMAYRVIKETGNNLKNIEDFGKSMLIYDILDNSKKELKFLGKNLQNVETVSKSITEFKKHNITVDRLSNLTNNIEDEYLKAKLEDIYLVYDKFQNSIKEKFLEDRKSVV